MTVAQTTLNGAIASAGATTCTVRDVLGFASSAETSDLVQIDSEFILVGGGLGTTSWSSLTRGYAGSTATTHSDGATVSRLERGYTDATRLSGMSKAGAVDYSYIRDCAAQANSWLNGEVGRFFGPSTDTIRTYDVEFESNELLIAGGFRSFSKVELKLNSASSTWIDVTADSSARPLTWDLIDGLAYDRIVLSDYPTLGYRYFYPGIAVARLTAVFGPAVPPDALRRVADTVGWWLYQSRGAGQSGIVGPVETGEIVQLRVLSPMDWHTIKLYRGVGPSLYAMPAF